MYKVKKFMVPEGYKFSEYAKILAKEIIEGRDVEDNKDKLFRMTYPAMYEYVMKFKNLYSEEYLISDMSIAFMRTIRNFNPDADNASFLNYYKLATKTTIFNNYYGKYKKNEESRQLKRDIDNLMSSLEEPVYDSNGKNTGTWHDLTQDESFEIDTDIMRDCIHEDIYNSIDAVFREYGQGKKTARSQKIFTTYVTDILNDNKRTQLDIGNQYGVSKYAVCRILQRYSPLLKEELIKRGY